MADVHMDVSSASANNQFISSLIKSLQTLCHSCMDFDAGIEVVGYLNINIDSGSGVDYYVLDEKVMKRSTTNSNSMITFVSNSFRAKKEELPPNTSKSTSEGGSCSPISELNSYPQHRAHQGDNDNWYQKEQPSTCSNDVVNQDRAENITVKYEGEGSELNYHEHQDQENYSSHYPAPQLYRSDFYATHSQGVSGSQKSHWPGGDSGVSDQTNSARSESVVYSIKADPDAARNQDSSAENSTVNTAAFETKTETETETDILNSFLCETDPDSKSDYTGGENITGELKTDISDSFLQDQDSNKTDEDNLSGDLSNIGYTAESTDNDMISNYKNTLLYYAESANTGGEGGEESNETHGVEIPHKCFMCGKEFDNGQELQKHNKLHTGGKAFVCSFCGKAFSHNQDLQRHIGSRHTGEKPFKCGTCDKGFSCSRGLAQHKTTHLAEQSFHCSICSRQFTHKNYLKRHIGTHSLEKPFKCLVCEKSFASNRYLKEHTRTHTDEKPFKCLICDKSFKCSPGLIRHKKIHNGKKPSKCVTCGKVFALYSTLKIHSRTHCGGKPYKCLICDRAFTSSSHLSLHNKTHIGEKVYECATCGKEFNCSSNLKKHIINHSGE